MLRMKAIPRSVLLTMTNFFRIRSLPEFLIDILLCLRFSVKKTKKGSICLNLLLYNPQIDKRKLPHLDFKSQGNREIRVNYTPEKS